MTLANGTLMLTDKLVCILFNSAGNPRAAKIAGRISLLLGLVGSVAISILLLALRGEIARVFTSDEDTVAVFAALILIVVLILVVDTANGASIGCDIKLHSNSILGFRFC